MKHTIFIDDKPIVFIYADNQIEFDVDEILKVDYANLYGESATIALIQNKVGDLMAETEYMQEQSKLKCSFYEADFEKRLRAEANRNNGLFSIEESDGTTSTVKLTDKSIEAAKLSDKKRNDLKLQEIKDKRNFNKIKSIYNSVVSKSKKLEFLVPKVTPKEHYEELLEGQINNVMIKKLSK